MEMERKTFTGIELKDEKKGSFTAKIAELNVIDKDGDVTLPGAFPAGKTILISAYQHGSWMGELPVGPDDAERGPHRGRGPAPGAGRPRAGRHPDGPPRHRPPAGAAGRAAAGGHASPRRIHGAPAEAGPVHP